MTGIFTPAYSVSKTTGSDGSPGLLREERRGSLEDLHVFAQLPVLPAQRRQLLPLGAGQPAITAAPGIAFGLTHPLPDRGLGQVEVAGDLPDRAVTLLAQLDDLGLELGRERPPRARLFAFHGVHDGHPLRGSTPDGGCPSKRVRPRGPLRAQLGLRRTLYTLPSGMVLPYTCPVITLLGDHRWSSPVSK